MSFLTNMIKELRDRKLWPIAIGLIVALVAVPILLSKKAPTKLLVPQPTGGLPYSTGTSLPAISVKTTPSALQARRPRPRSVHASARRHDRDGGDGHDHDADHADDVRAEHRSPPAAARAVRRPVAARPRWLRTPTTPAPTPTTPAPTPKPTPKPGPTGLTDTQSYQVSLAITNANGGVDTIDPLERLSVLPSLSSPSSSSSACSRAVSRCCSPSSPAQPSAAPERARPVPSIARSSRCRPARPRASRSRPRPVDSGGAVLGQLDHRRRAPVGRRREPGPTHRVRGRSSADGEHAFRARSLYSSTTRVSAPSSTCAI